MFEGMFRKTKTPDVVPQKAPSSPEAVLADRQAIISKVKWYMEKGQFHEAYGVIEGRRIGAEGALKPVGQQDLDEVGEAFDQIQFLNELEDQVDKAEQATKTKAA